MRKQAAITLRCMQALVRVQARVRARRVRMALETQVGPQTAQQQQLSQENHIKEIEVCASNQVVDSSLCAKKNKFNIGFIIFCRKVGVIVLDPYKTFKQN